MKKQIIVIASVALAAVLLFTSYALFFKDDGIDEAVDPFYTITDDVKTALSEIDTKVEILLSSYDSDDANWEMIYRYIELFEQESRKISMKAEDIDGFKGVVVQPKDDSASNSQKLEFDSFFKKLYDGTYYAFDGESLVANAIFSVCGKEEMDISLRALSGYDTDGDVVTANGAPFLFPSVQRSEISFLTIKNSHGEYSIYKDEGDFYYGSSRAVAYDNEAFSLLTTNCRYAVAVGKMAIPEGKSWATYGLDDEKNTTANYTIMTDTDKDGNYRLHTVYIGNLSSTGSYYYARYIGAIFTPSGEEGVADKLVHNLSKDILYFLPVDAVDNSIALPETASMQPMIVNAITSSNEIYNVQNIRIDFYNDEISAVARKMLEFNQAPNLSAIDASSLTKVIGDKVSVDSYSGYSDGWQNHIDVFGAFTSSDGKSTYIEAALTRSGSGDYRVKFGLLRDEANGAYLPARVTLTQSYDGVNFLPIENGEIITDQSDKSIKHYELEFSSEDTVKYVRIVFDVPQKAKTYVVFDEIRIYCNDLDCQPVSSVGGNWKLTSPPAYIKEGMNYSYLDMTNFYNFIQSLAALEGDSVVACGFSNNGDASSIDSEKLAKYGLDKPDKHFSFEYQGVVTDVYFSAVNENGKYYAYSTFKGEIKGGTKVNATTDVIVEISKETAPWLAWDMVEYLDHSLFSIFVAEIDKMDITADGKTYEFDLSATDSNLTGVKLDGKDYDVTSFKYLYQSIISIQMRDAYVPTEDETPEEYFRFKIHTETNSPEIVFYRVSSSKCYFTIDGEGGYYVLVEDVNEARDRLFAYLDGEILTK